MNDNNDSVNWDKVNRGKVRYGFALELYKRGGMLTPSDIGEIEAFVDYVMLGVEALESSHKVGKERLMTENECREVLNNKNANEDDYVRATIHSECRDLDEEDVKKIMTAYNSGRITIANLDDCVNRIAGMKSKK